MAQKCINAGHSPAHESPKQKYSNRIIVNGLLYLSLHKISVYCKNLLPSNYALTRYDFRLISNTYNNHLEKMRSVLSITVATIVSVASLVPYTNANPAPVPIPMPAAKPEAAPQGPTGCDFPGYDPFACGWCYWYYKCLNPDGSWTNDWYVLSISRSIMYRG